jgi:hypothetical protein
MSLEFNRVRAAIGDGINERMRYSQAAIVCLCHFAHDQAGVAGSDFLFTDFDQFNVHFPHLTSEASISAVRWVALPSR